MAAITEGGADNAVQANAGANITTTGSDDIPLTGTIASVLEDGSGNAVDAGAGSIMVRTTTHAMGRDQRGMA